MWLQPDFSTIFPFVVCLDVFGDIVNILFLINLCSILFVSLCDFCLDKFLCNRGWENTWWGARNQGATSVFFQKELGQAVFVPIVSQHTCVTISGVKTIQPSLHLGSAFSFNDLGLGQERPSPLYCHGIGRGRPTPSHFCGWMWSTDSSQEDTVRKLSCAAKIRRVCFFRTPIMLLL